jgi:two-component system OmpR family response regulator
VTPRILLVEDEPDISLIARAALLRAGFHVTTASTGVEALAAAAAERFDLILLDWMLPELDGFETCARLKAHAQTASIPVIFLTAKRNDADQAKCMEVGALGWIGKPFNPLELGNQIKAMWRAAAENP